MRQFCERLDDIQQARRIDCSASHSSSSSSPANSSNAFAAKVCGGDDDDEEWGGGSLDPSSLLNVVEALAKLTHGLPIDPASGAILS